MVCALFMPRTAIKTEAADATTQSLQDKISALSSQIKEYESKISNLKSEKADKMEYKASLDSLAAVTQQKIEVAEALSKQLTEQIEDTTTKIAEKEEAIKGTFAKFLERLVVSYEEGDASYLSIILNSSDMGDFLTKMDMVSSMLEYDRNLKIQYENERTDLQATKAQLEEDKKYQETLMAQLEEDKKNYESLADEQSTYILSLENDLSAATSAFEEAKAQENALDAQLQAHLAELAEQARRAQQANGGTDIDAANVFIGGGFGWPLPGHTYISSGFGYRTLGGNYEFHRGIDIPAPYGTPIVASKGGKVITATGHYSYGNHVVIDHGLNGNGVGESTLYAHMSSIAVSVGQYVNQGDVIGYVGSTGYSTGNHTHFEVRLNGEVNNPLNFVVPQ